VILALVRSELQALAGYLESDLPRLCATPEGSSVGQSGRAAAAPLREALAEVAALLGSGITSRAQLDQARDQLVEATKESVGILASSLDSGLGRATLFEDESDRTELSLRLRQDIWVFREVCRSAAAELDEQEPGPESVEPLRRFATEFRDVGYQLLRHSDRETFDRFLSLLEGWSSTRGGAGAARTAKLREDCRRFGEILDRAFEAISRRAELQRRPVDSAAFEAELERHLLQRKP
jgi:hypothetical protein